MPAGTIALTNKSATVAGTGTSFTTELKAGDFVYVNVGGAPYTLVAANITSDTQLTLSVAFDGPTTSGLAWNSVPASLQVAITQKILNDFASVARGRILDFQNWQKIYSDAQSVDVIRPDRTTFTGPSWGYMAAQYANKADKSALDAYAKKGANSDITSLIGMTTALSIAQGGTGAKTKADAWTALATFGNSAGTAAQGNDNRLNSLDGKSGGSVSSQIFVNQQSSDVADLPLILRRSQYVNGVWFGGGIRFYLRSDLSQEGADMYIQRNSNGERLFYQRIFNGDGSIPAVFSFSSNGSYYAYNGSFQSLSDKRIKDEIETIKDPLAKMKQISGVTFRRRDTGNWGIGFIAQDVETVFPEAVSDLSYDVTLKDGSVVKGVKSPDTANVAAALHHEAILALMEKIEQRDAAIEELQKRVRAIDGLDA
ncbi:tail fiber domain-containing protein [Pantoea ananatis]|uniref:tail fiber domain-containing protein n=1 Tax=Pantoea ananas TaxID=553 RepID=UPI002024FBFC|nr:tail fiber domain-containing protein [Pantoea ananatis]URL13335.1 tail fiber domain-containing protein [Pantoea ananatis]